VDDPYSNISEEEEGEMAGHQQQKDPENYIASELSDDDIDNAELARPAVKSISKERTSRYSTTVL
jgi:hypothetical protein